MDVGRWRKGREKRKKEETYGDIVAQKGENWLEGLYCYRGNMGAFLVYWTSKLIFPVFLLCLFLD